MTHQQQQRRFSAQDARQGRIILQSRAAKVLFAAGLAGLVVLAIVFAA